MGLEMEEVEMWWEVGRAGGVALVLSTLVCEII